MSKKFHIGKNGNPSLCKAKKRSCPLILTSSSNTHKNEFKSKNEAMTFLGENNGEINVYTKASEMRNKEERFNNTLGKERKMESGGIIENVLTEENQGLSVDLSQKIYRVILDPIFWSDDSEVKKIYPIGCSKTYTGFFTKSHKDAKNILNFLDESYMYDYRESPFFGYPSVIIETTLGNVELKGDFKDLKTYDNKLFDSEEIFVAKIKDESKLTLKKYYERRND